MESQADNSKGNSVKKPSRKKKMSLDCYLNFLLSRQDFNLTVHFIHQTINMHGFKCIKNTRKKELFDTLSTLDLMDPSRSTLRENITPDAFLTVEEVIGDLNDLNWQECCSVQTLTSWEGRLFPSSGSDHAAAQPASLQCTNISTKRKPGRKRSESRMVDINDSLRHDGVGMGKGGKRMVQKSKMNAGEVIASRGSGGDNGSLISGLV